MNALYRVFSFKHQYTLSMLKDAFLYPNSNFRRIRYKLLSKLKSLKFCYQYWSFCFSLKLIYTHFSPSDVFRSWSHPHCPCSSLFSSYAFVDIDRLTFSSLFYHQYGYIVAQAWFESMQTVESETSTIGANWQPFFDGVGLLSLITVSALSLFAARSSIIISSYISFVIFISLHRSSAPLCAVVLCLPLLAFS